MTQPTWLLRGLLPFHSSPPLFFPGSQQPRLLMLRWSEQGTLHSVGCHDLSSKVHEHPPPKESKDSPRLLKGCGASWSVASNPDHCFSGRPSRHQDDWAHNLMLDHSRSTALAAACINLQLADGSLHWHSPGPMSGIEPPHETKSCAHRVSVSKTEEPSMR